MFALQFKLNCKMKRNININVDATGEIDKNDFMATAITAQQSG
jgi:hypothetical protein